MTRTRSVFSLAPALVFFTALWAPGAAAQTRRPSLDEVFPASTWFQVRFAGLGGARDAFAKSWAGTLGTRPGIAESVTGLLQKNATEIEHAVRHVRGGLQQLGLQPETVRALLDGPLALGLGRPTLVGPAPVPSILLVADIAGREDRVLGAIRALEDLLRSQLPETPAGTFEVNGVRAARLGPLPGGPIVCRAVVEGYLLIGLNEPYLREAITTLQGKGNSLAAKPSFARSRARVHGESMASMYLDVDHLIGWTDRFLPYEAPQIGKLLGIEGLNGIYAAIGTDAHSSAEVFYVDAPGSEHGLFKALGGRPATFKAATWCPANSFFFGAASLDLVAVRDAIGALMEFVPQSTRREIEKDFGRGLRGALRGSGLSKEMLVQALETFGPEISLCAAMPPHGGLVPEGLAFWEVRDEARAEQMLAGLVGMLGPEAHQKVAFKDRTIHFVRMEQGGPSVLTPCFVVMDGMVIASTNVLTLKNTISRGSARKDSLALDERFQKATSVDGSHAAFMEFRLPLLVRTAHATAMPYVESFLRQNPQFGVDPDAIPSPEELAGMMDDVTASITVDKQGFEFRERTPVGPGLALAAFGAAADWVLEKAGKSPVATGQPKAQVRPGKIF